MNGPTTGTSLFSTLIAGLLVAANVIVLNINIRNYDKRYDLTRDRRFEVAQGTENILAKIKDTVQVKCYVSSNLPQRFSHVERTLLEKLNEYEKRAPGKLIFEFVDPESSKETKQECDDLGIRPQQLMDVEGGTTPKQVISYLAMVFRYVDRKAILDLFAEMPESLMDPAQFTADLEYYLTSNVLKVASEKKTIGLMAEISEVPVSAFDPNQKRKTQGLDNLQRWLERSYDVVRLDPREIGRGVAIPPEVNTLIVHKPAGITPVGQYLLDQFLMNGGALLFLIDAGTVDVQPKQKQSQMGRQTVQDFDFPTYAGQPLDTGVSTLLESWGVKVEPSFIQDQSNIEAPYYKDKQIVQDPLGRVIAQPIQDFAAYPSWMLVPARDASGAILDKDQVKRDNGIVSRLGAAVFTWASPVTAVAESLKRNEATFEALLKSGPNSWALPIAGSTFAPSKNAAEMPAERRQATLAALVTGRFRSSFKGQDIPTAPGADGKPTPPTEDLVRSRRDDCAKPATFMVIGDADFLFDGLLGAIMQLDGRKTANRDKAMAKAREALSFVTRGIDVLTYGGEGSDLIEIKNKRILSRDIVKLEEKDERRTRTNLINFLYVPGLVAALGILRWIVRAATTGHSSRA